MYRINASDEKAAYEVKELAKMFVPESEIELVLDGSMLSKNEQKRMCYRLLSEACSKELDWGILTGVRPEKLFRQLVRENSVEAAKKILTEEYFVSSGKIALLEETYKIQCGLNYDTNPKAIGLYIGIPFCPTRCLYCSFTSNVITKAKASAYMLALEKEISAVKLLMEKQGLYAESVYIGGGTPTALDDEDFEKLLCLTKDNFIGSNTKEWTVECGRPDTITEKKLKLISDYGAGRISINPQTMKEDTLKTIGRAHTPQQILEAYQLARKYDFVINMDLITGLPGESPEDFKNTLETVLALDPENITVHTLAVKKASRLIEEDPGYAFRQAENVRQMLETAAKLLKDKFSPYYLYRQKHMAGNFENVGYERDNTASIYNVRIMEEDQTIIALGAGGISKVYYPSENRLERVANVSNYEIYIERIDEMIQRKEIGIVL